MLRARSVTLSFVWTLATLLACSGIARAQEKSSHGEAKGHAPAKYSAEIVDPATHKETTQEFDLSRAEDQHKLEEALREGHVHSLHLNEPPTIFSLFSLATDLGVCRSSSSAFSCSS